MRHEPDFNPDALRIPELEFKTELTGEWLGSAKAFIFDALEQGRDISYATPYENIALARSVDIHGVRHVEIYLTNRTVRSSFALESHDADRFWKWYAE